MAENGRARPIFAKSYLGNSEISDDPMFWAGWSCFGLVPIGDFDITAGDMRRIEKCRKMLSFFEVSTGGTLYSAGRGFNNKIFCVSRGVHNIFGN